MNEKNAEIVRLRSKGLSQAEIAEHLGISQSAVSQRMRLTMKKDSKKHILFVGLKQAEKLLSERLGLTVKIETPSLGFCAGNVVSS